MKRKLLIFVIILVIIAGVGGGLNYYRKYIEEKKRLAALEEQKRQDELEKERQRKLLEEKQKEFYALIEDMKKYFALGDFDRVKELAREALALAEKYNFNADEVYAILRDVDVATHLGRLKELKQMNEDIYRYLYVREEALKIPEWLELKEMREQVLSKTYENEYLVELILAKNNAVTGKKGEMVSYYYLASRENLHKAIQLRQERGIARSGEEDAVRELQRELFFSSEELMQKTIPPGLY